MAVPELPAVDRHFWRPLDLVDPGHGVGLATGVPLMRLLAGQLYGIAPHDVTTLGVSLIDLLVAGADLRPAGAASGASRHRRRASERVTRRRPPTRHPRVFSLCQPVRRMRSGSRARRVRRQVRVAACGTQAQLRQAAAAAVRRRFRRTTAGRASPPRHAESRTPRAPASRCSSVTGPPADSAEVNILDIGYLPNVFNVSPGRRMLETREIPSPGGVDCRPFLPGRAGNRGEGV